SPAPPTCQIAGSKSSRYRRSSSETSRSGSSAPRRAAWSSVAIGRDGTGLPTSVMASSEAGSRGVTQPGREVRRVRRRRSSRRGLGGRPEQAGGGVGGSGGRGGGQVDAEPLRPGRSDRDVQSRVGALPDGSAAAQRLRREGPHRPGAADQQERS